jgi:plasmid maintenance system antidote protein VapI
MNQSNDILVNSWEPSVVFHPGETVGEKIQELKMTIQAISLETGIPISDLVSVLEGRSSISVTLASALEKATGISSRFLIAQQLRYDEYIRANTSDPKQQFSL